MHRDNNLMDPLYKNCINTVQHLDLQKRTFTLLRYKHCQMYLYFKHEPTILITSSLMFLISYRNEYWISAHTDKIRIALLNCDYNIYSVITFPLSCTFLSIKLVLISDCLSHGSNIWLFTAWMNTFNFISHCWKIQKYCV